MQICPLLQIKAIESPKTTTTELHVLPQHPRHMYCDTVKTKFFQSSLCLSYPMHTSCGHYIHKSTAKTNKQINKTTIILILIKTQKKYPKGINHFLTYFLDETHVIPNDLILICTFSAMLTRICQALLDQ